MRKKSLPVPVLGALAVTRGMLGAGAGLLLSPRLSAKKRKVIGFTLMGIGIATTIPLASAIFSK